MTVDVESLCEGKYVRTALCKTAQGYVKDGTRLSPLVIVLNWLTKCEHFISEEPMHFLTDLNPLHRLKFILMGIDRSTITVWNLDNLKIMVQKEENNVFISANSYVSKYRAGL